MSRRNKFRVVLASVMSSFYSLDSKSRLLDKNIFINKVRCLPWVRGLMAINVGCEFRDRGSIPIVCQITDAEIGQVG